MVNGSSSRATACALSTLLLVGCSSPVESPSTGSSGAGGASGSANSAEHAGVAGSGLGGHGLGGHGLGGHAGNSGAGGAAAAQAVTLNFSWSTYWLKGTTKTPLTCADLGAQAVGFSISGDTPGSAEQVLSSTGEFCATGSLQNYPLALPPGSYSLGVSLSAGLAADNTLKALLSGLASFTIAPGTTHVDIPEIKLVRIMLPLSWSIEKGGTTATCSSVGATRVDLVLTEARDDYMNTISWSQPCSLNPSQPLAKPGTYQLSATLKNDSSTLASWMAPEKLSFSNESAAIPPAITFKVP